MSWNLTHHGMTVADALARVRTYLDRPPAQTPTGELAALTRCVQDLEYGLHPQFWGMLFAALRLPQPPTNVQVLPVLERCLENRRRVALRERGQRMPTEADARAAANSLPVSLPSPLLPVRPPVILPGLAARKNGRKASPKYPGFGARAKAAMLRAGINGRDLAGRLQLTPATFSGWMREHTGPTPQLLPALAAILGVTVDWLCGREEPAAAAAIEEARTA